MADFFMMRFRKLTLLCLGTLLLLLLIITQWNDHYRGYRLSDWLAWLDSGNDHAETRFAPGFSEKLFRKVKTGMTRNEVEHIIGKPLDRQPDRLCDWSRPGEYWDYSLPVSNIWNYHLRCVIFDPDGKVFVVGREYCCDGDESWF